MNISRILRILAAVAALVAGYAHVALYFDGYKDIPVGNIGTQFLLNAASAVVIAAGLLAPMLWSGAPAWLSKAAPAVGLGWGATSLLAFKMARTDRGWFGFNDIPGFNPSPEAQLSVFPEIIVVLCCLVLLVPALSRQNAKSGRQSSK